MLIDELTGSHRDALNNYLERFGRILVAVLDPDGRIVDCNGRFVETFSLTDKPVGADIDDIVAPAEGETIAWPAQGRTRRVDLMSIRDSVAAPTVSFQVTRDAAGMVMFATDPAAANEDVVARLTGVNAELTNLTRELEKDRRALSDANRRIAELARTDELTGLANRRFFNEMLGKAIAAARRHDHALSIAMGDLDHFKRINDTHGHEAGDRVLRAFSRLLLGSCRQEDLPARWGGEEFIVLMPQTTAAAAAKFADRVRGHFAECEVERVDQPLSVSWGIARYRDGDTIESLIGRADKALYAAKDAGRNTVIVDESAD